MYSADWKSHIFLMKNKLISDLTSQTKAGRGMAGAPGAAVTQERPEQNHYGTLYIGAQDQHTNMVITTMAQSEQNHYGTLYNHEHNLSTTTSTSCTKGHKTNTTTIVYKSTTPAHLIHLHIPEQGHQHHSVQSAQEPNTLKGCLLLDIFNSYIMVIHVRGYVYACECIGGRVDVSL